MRFTALKYLTNLPYTDFLLSGGLPSSSITLIYGEPCSWKSSLSRAIVGANRAISWYLSFQADREGGEFLLRDSAPLVSRWKDIPDEIKILVVDGVDEMVSWEENNWQDATYPTDKRDYDVEEFVRELRKFAVARDATVILTSQLSTRPGSSWTAIPVGTLEHISTRIKTSSRGRTRDVSGVPIGEYVTAQVEYSTLIPAVPSHYPELGYYGVGLDPLWSRTMLDLHQGRLVRNAGRLYNQEMKFLGRLSEYRYIQHALE